MDSTKIRTGRLSLSALLGARTIVASFPCITHALYGARNGIRRAYDLMRRGPGFDPRDSTQMA